MEIDTQEWLLLEKHLRIIGNKRSIRHQQSIKIILDGIYPTEIPITEIEELTWQDIFDAFVTLMTSIHQVALQDERYEAIPLINKAFELQSNIVESFIKHSLLGEDERIELNEWLANKNKYYNEFKNIVD